MNGNLAGHVRIYQWGLAVRSSSWSKLGGDIDGEAAMETYATPSPFLVMARCHRPLVNGNSWLTPIYKA